MATYLVYTPPAGSPVVSTAEARFLTDGKSVFALILPLLWLVWHRLWIWLCLYLVLVVAITLLADLTGNMFIAALSALPAIFFFLEGEKLRGRKLERDGWNLAGIVEAGGSEEAEQRFFANLAVDAGQQTRPVEMKPARKRAGIPVNTVGIFPE